MSGFPIFNDHETPIQSSECQPWNNSACAQKIFVRWIDSLESPDEITIKSPWNPFEITINHHKILLNPVKSPLNHHEFTINYGMNPSQTSIFFMAISAVSTCRSARTNGWRPPCSTSTRRSTSSCRAVKTPWRRPKTPARWPRPNVAQPWIFGMWIFLGGVQCSEWNSVWWVLDGFLERVLDGVWTVLDGFWPGFWMVLDFF